jgi:hypothetical protein
MAGDAREAKRRRVEAENEVLRSTVDQLQTYIRAQGLLMPHQPAAAP